MYVADRQTGTFIEEVATVDEGLKLIGRYEETDKAEGTYEEDFYSIVDEDHCVVTDGRKEKNMSKLRIRRIGEKANGVAVAGDLEFYVPDGCDYATEFQAAVKEAKLSQFMGLNVVSNTSGVGLTAADNYGAAGAFANTALLKMFAEQNDCERVFVIPSSVHEVLLVAAMFDGPNASDLTDVIQSVNQTLDPKDVLSDHVYIYDVNDGWVTD